MPRKNLLIALAALTFLAHSLEEYFTNFHNVDISVIWSAQLLGISNLALWLIVQAIVCILLIHFWKTTGTPSKIFGWIIFAIFIFELSHPIHALLATGYVSGLITSLVFPILAYYWYKLLHSLA